MPGARPKGCASGPAAKADDPPGVQALADEPRQLPTRQIGRLGEKSPLGALVGLAEPGIPEAGQHALVEPVGLLATGA